MSKRTPITVFKAQEVLADVKSNLDFEAGEPVYMGEPGDLQDLKDKMRRVAAWVEQNKDKFKPAELTDFRNNVFYMNQAARNFEQGLMVKRAKEPLVKQVKSAVSGGKASEAGPSSGKRKREEKAVKPKKVKAPKLVKAPRELTEDEKRAMEQNKQRREVNRMKKRIRFDYMTQEPMVPSKAYTEPATAYFREALKDSRDLGVARVIRDPETGQFRAFRFNKLPVYKTGGLVK